jgi:HK97 family phage portal protein
MKRGENMKIMDKVFVKVFKNQLNDFAKRFLSGDDSTIDVEYEIDSDTAMTYTAVFACNRVLAETLASTPIKVYKKTSQGRKEVNNIDIYDILHNSPNEEMSPFNFKEVMMVNLNLGGNAFAQKILNKFGDLIGLNPLAWQDVKIDRDKSGKLIYKVKVENGKEEILTRKDIFHIPNLSYDGVNGLSPIEYVNRAIKLGLSYEEFGEKFYQNGANASGIVEHPEAMSDESFLRFKREFAQAFQGLANSGKPIILEGGAKYTQLTMKPADAQLIESKRFQIEDIARIYRVPLHLIQELSRSTNNNIEQQSLEFVMYTMLPHFQRWEENINMQLLTREQRKAGYYVEFKIDNLLRGDAKSRAEAYRTGRDAGYLSVNEIRKMENMDPIPNGDIYLQPMNYIEAGKEPVEIEKETPFEQEQEISNKRIYSRPAKLERR